MGGIPLGAEDAARLHMSMPVNPMTITAVLVFDRALGREALFHVLEERLLRHPRFRWKVVEPRFGLGMPRWVDDPRFDLGDHVVVLDLPGDGGQRELEDVVSEIASTPLDARRPLWRMHLVNGVEGGSALVVTVNHALADGAALLGILEGLADERGGPRDDASAEPPAGSRVRRLVTGVVSAARLAARRADPPTSLRGRLGIEKRVAYSSALDVEQLVGTGRALNAGVAGVLMAAVTGALRTELHVGPHDRRLVLHALLPINLPRETPGALGNRYGSILVPLAVGRADLVDRVSRVRDDLRRLRSHGAVNAGARIAAAAGVATARIERLGVAFYSRKASVMVSNVRGPARSLHVAGATVRDLIVWAPCSGSIALGVTLMSYAGQARLAVLADAGIIGDPRRIVRALELEVAALGTYAAANRGHTGAS